MTLRRTEGSAGTLTAAAKKCKPKTKEMEERDVSFDTSSSSSSLSSSQCASSLVAARSSIEPSTGDVGDGNKEYGFEWAAI
jgi:hypothetical protein